MIRARYRVGRTVEFPNGHPLQAAYGTGDRVTVTASDTSTAEAALPTGARVLFVRASDAVWIRFGNTGMGAAAADDDSELFPAGVAVLLIPLHTNGEPFTHFRVLRVGSENCVVQVESIAHVDGV
jgi:hypothetical protein